MSRVHGCLRMQRQERGFLFKAGEEFELTVTQMWSERCETLQGAEMGAVPASSSGELSLTGTDLFKPGFS